MKQRTLIAFVALAILVTIIGAPQSGDTKKIKLKDLKKLKKYAYLLAGQRKKFYAIPFPFPLPVFVKRQQIYTQIPVIHRQVTAPQPYGLPSMSSGDSYEAMSSSYSTPEPKYPAGEEYYAPSSNYATPKKPPRSSSHRYPSSSSYLGSLSSGLASPSSKYLSQIMSLALNQASPGAAAAAAATSASSGTSLGMTTGREVIGKLLSGQAKVLSPTSLISTLKRPTATSQEQSSSSGYENEQKSSSSAGGSSSSTGSGGGGATDDSGSSSASGTKSSGNSASDSVETTKPSASEMHRSRMRAQRHLRHFQSPFAAYQTDPFRLASMMQYSPYVNPLAAVTGLTAPIMPRLPFQMPIPLTIQAQQLAASGARLPSIGGDLLASLAESQQQQMLDQSANNQADSQQDPQEVAASSQQDYEMIPSAGVRNQPINGQQYLMAMQRFHGQQQQHQRQQEELRLALMRERQALRLAESRAILMRAHQLGLPENDDHVRMLRYYRPQVMR